MSDDWGLEFLRFTKKQACEMTSLGYIGEVPRPIQLPSNNYTLACLLQTRMASPTKGLHYMFWSWKGLAKHHISTTPVFILHVGFRRSWFYRWNAQTCRPRPETIDQEESHSGHKHLRSMQFLAVVTPDGLIPCLDGPYERQKGDWGMWREGLQKTVVRMMATGRSIW